jgi:hypothetical protein
MRLTTVAMISLVASSSISSAQVRLGPPVFRGPFYASLPATIVETQAGLPLEFTNARLEGTLGSDRLWANVASRTLRTITPSGITLRVAYGPARNGIVTVRMRAVVSDELSGEAPPRFTPRTGPHLLAFQTVPEDPHLGLQALSPSMTIAFTLERLQTEDGQLVFENPDAIELLWQALGRPTLRTMRLLPRI